MEPVNKTFVTGIIMAMVTALPLEARRRLFTCFSAAFYHLSLKHRIITISNLARAFPEKKISEIIKISKAVYRHLGLVAAETFEIPELTRANISKLVDIDTLDENLLRLPGDGPLILFTGHHGNWELLAATLALLARPVAVIYRPLDSVLLENLLAWIRTSKGNEVLPKERAMLPIVRRLRKGEVVGILIDQNMAWQEGVFVDFFGQPACTTDGLALVALRSDIPVVPAFMVRTPSGTYRLIVENPVPVIKTGDKNRDVIINTQNFTRVIEDIVRKYPEQWLWIHQRWKTKELQVRR